MKHTIIQSSTNKPLNQNPPQTNIDLINVYNTVHRGSKFMNKESKTEVKDNIIQKFSSDCHISEIIKLVSSLAIIREYISQNIDDEIIDHNDPNKHEIYKHLQITLNMCQVIPLNYKQVLSLLKNRYTGIFRRQIPDKLGLLIKEISKKIPLVIKPSTRKWLGSIYENQTIIRSETVEIINNSTYKHNKRAIPREQKDNNIHQNQHELDTLNNFLGKPHKALSNKKEFTNRQTNESLFVTQHNIFNISPKIKPNIKAITELPPSIANISVTETNVTNNTTINTKSTTLHKNVTSTLHKSDLHNALKIHEGSVADFNYIYMRYTNNKIFDMTTESKETFEYLIKHINTSRDHDVCTLIILMIKHYFNHFTYGSQTMQKIFNQCLKMNIDIDYICRIMQSNMNQLLEKLNDKTYIKLRTLLDRQTLIGLDTYYIRPRKLINDNDTSEIADPNVYETLTTEQINAHNNHITSLIFEFKEHLRKIIENSFTNPKDEDYHVQISRWWDLSPNHIEEFIIREDYIYEIQELQNRIKLLREIIPFIIKSHKDTIGNPDYVGLYNSLCQLIHSLRLNIYMLTSLNNRSLIAYVTYPLMCGDSMCNKQQLKELEKIFLQNEAALKELDESLKQLN